MAGTARLGLDKRRNAGKGRKAGRQEGRSGTAMTGLDRSGMYRSGKAGRGEERIGCDWQGLARNGRTVRGVERLWYSMDSSGTAGLVWL